MTLGKSLVLVLLASVGLLSQARAVEARAPAVRVTGGWIEGTTHAGIATFKGIPYAAPPIDELRWTSPHPVPSWKGTRTATEFAAPCYQSTSDRPPSEDCLYLNVWSGAVRGGARRPVMVWIHGGGYIGGATSEPRYDGASFARQGVVLVSVGYRLGVFGYLAHPALGQSPAQASGVFGLEDMLAALKWVKANIASFGGDPARVTLFGESAGASAVSLLAGSPAAKGLYQRAIAESGALFTTPRGVNDPDPVGHRLLSRPVAEAFGEQFLKDLGVGSIDEARRLPPDRVWAAADRLSQGHTRFAPSIDGTVLRGANIEFFRQGLFNDTPILIGYNSNEAGDVTPNPTAAAFAHLAEEGSVCTPEGQLIQAAYPHATDDEAAQAFRDLAADASNWNMWTWARMQALRGSGSVHFYVFDVRNTHWPHGSPHAVEIPYVFGNPAPEWDASDHRVSDLMQRYWVNFATHGDPNGPGLPTWPSFRETRQQALVFGEATAARELPGLARLRAVDAIYGCLRGPTTLVTPADLHHHERR